METKKQTGRRERKRTGNCCPEEPEGLSKHEEKKREMPKHTRHPQKTESDADVCWSVRKPPVRTLRVLCGSGTPVASFTRSLRAPLLPFKALTRSLPCFFPIRFLRHPVRLSSVPSSPSRGAKQTQISSLSLPAFLRRGLYPAPHAFTVRSSHKKDTRSFDPIFPECGVRCGRLFSLLCQVVPCRIRPFSPSPSPSLSHRSRFRARLALGLHIRSD